MNLKQKLFYSIAGFLIGNIFLLSLYFGINRRSNDGIPLAEAIQRIQSDEVREVNINAGKADFKTRSGSEFTSFGITENEREVLLRTILDVNRENSVNKVKWSEAPADKDPLFYLFQILFWLFFISPPVIVVLLLIIIKKMSRKDSMS